MLLLIVHLPPDNLDTLTILDHVSEVVCTDEAVEQGVAANENKSDWKSALSATAKLLLRGVKESADAFPPLKSVASGLCFILDNYEVRPSFPTHCRQR